MTERFEKKEVPGKRKKRFARFFTEFTIDKKTRKWLLILTGIGILLGVLSALINTIGPLFFLLIIPSIILATGSPGILFVLSEKRMTRNVMIQLLFLFLGLFWKRMHWPGASVLITVSLISMSIAYFFLALKMIYSVKNNTYFKIIGAIAALFISLISTGMAFKFQHWPGAGIFVTLSLVPSLVFTMIVLITLPGSGYIQWKSKYKLLFTRKLLLPWMFFLLFAAVSLLIPKDLSNQLFSKDRADHAPFRMDHYEIEQVEGLEANQ